MAPLNSPGSCQLHLSQLSGFKGAMAIAMFDQTSYDRVTGVLCGRLNRVTHFISQWLCSPRAEFPIRRLRVVVSPLATLAFKLCVVGDTRLKTGWVRCKHGAGVGGTMVQILLVALEISPACVCLSVTKPRARHHFTAILSKLHMRMAPALVELPNLQIRSVEGTRSIRVESWSRVTTWTSVLYLAKGARVMCT